MKTLTKITLITLALMVTIPFSAHGLDGQRKIAQTDLTTFPITISEKGSYVLTTNLIVSDPKVNAIEIKDSHVTLDLNGHMVRGPNTGGTGSGIGGRTFG